MAVPCAVEVDVREGNRQPRSSRCLYDRTAFPKARAEVNALCRDLGLATAPYQASGGVDVAPCACRMSSARLWSSCSHVERVLGPVNSAGSEDCMRFNVAWPIVMQERRCYLKRTVRASLPTL
jgi:hypothetical protein